MESQISINLLKEINGVELVARQTVFVGRRGSLVTNKD